MTDCNRDNPPLLGRNFLKPLGFDLVQVNAVSTEQYSSVINELKCEFSDVFEGFR